MCLKVMRCFPLAVVCIGMLAPTMPAQQRADVELTTKTGTLVEVAKKGRVQILKYTDEAGEEQEVILTAKIRAQVEAEGDAEFLQPGQFIATIATESNQKLFAKEVSVFLMAKGRAPAGQIAKAPPKPGESQNAYQVTGTIVAIGPDEDYPEYQRIEIKAAGPRAPLMLEKDFKVTVKSDDFSLAQAGTPIELEGTELKNGRFNIVRITAKLEQPLKVSDVLGNAEDQQPGKDKSEEAPGGGEP